MDTVLPERDAGQVLLSIGDVFDFLVRNPVITSHWPHGPHVDLLQPRRGKLYPWTPMLMGVLKQVTCGADNFLMQMVG